MAILTFCRKKKGKIDQADESNPISLVTTKTSEENIYVPGGFIRANGTSTKDRALFRTRASHIQIKINDTLHSLPEHEREGDIKEEEDEADA